MLTNPDGYTHDAVFFSTPETLVRAVTPFVGQGLDQGDSVVLACDPENNLAISGAFEHDDRLIFIGRIEDYGRAPTALEAFRRLTTRLVRERAAPVRLVGEVGFGPTVAHWREWSRFEAVSNVALAGYPLSVTCAYDTSRAPAEALDTAPRTHPHTRDGSRVTPNDEYVEPAVFLRMVAEPDVIPVETTAPDLVLDPVSLLEQAREEVRAVLRRHGLAEGPRREATEGFVLSVHELLVNGVTHGRPPVTLRMWVREEHLVATVTDRGGGFDDPFAGYLFDGAGVMQSDLGLWLVRRHCRDLSARRTPEGFTVRVVADL